MKNSDKPYVILNAAMTVDGKIASKTGNSQISCDRDLDRVHRLRSEVDGIMIGIETVLADDSELTVRRVKGENPIRIVIDSKGRTPSDARVLDDSAPTIIGSSELIKDRDKKRLQSLNAEVIITGEETVDLSSLLQILKKEKGMNKLLLEGGSTLNWSMMKEGLVDEIRIAIHPTIIGGKDAKTLVDGEGMEKIRNGIKLSLMNTEKVGKDIVLTYEWGNQDND
ncbi:5-amino-6-(5-phosphoribosylamino)uracil reductase [candidate division MSBL1 archaeon SCGC-AAA382A13]|uniref:2,5-diamino-6-(ribosylamino)-4(3H)-pyrimidinone 5'-phosphate reductase n=1 Tax=candidate division MSBL1 archaeon SCGC-AAA382A13 TaxID=1698279 RepID=A0A133VGW9_9EURY|nr:5-amino-6-(5-phosphoribosylamino)uracil reductase [candidate division MSBL1 archaeon SCGC-AAA382A13]